jgi:glutamyl-Q tRNA(Asp) synthetase
VRIEDLDGPRCPPGAAAGILKVLEQFGFTWDGPVVFQSDRHKFYADAFQELTSGGHTFPCACTRRDISEERYPGTCREGLHGRPARAQRLRVSHERISFHDRRLGEFQCDLEAECGDFVLRRADGFWAYQLAVVVDDHRQGITDVVRGADLLDSTPRQVHIQRLLEYPAPRYLHLPCVTNSRGEKLSKQTGAPALDPANATELLCRALLFLGQNPPRDLRSSSIESFWAWAIQNWNPESIPPERSHPL